MANEMSWNAADKKAGMSLEELEAAVDIVRSARPGVKWRLKATVGFAQQVQRITFVEVESEVQIPAA